MTDHTPLTDEELAKFEEWAKPPATSTWDHIVRRLIADLRAKNRRIKEVEIEVERLRAFMPQGFNLK